MARRVKRRAARRRDPIGMPLVVDSFQPQGMVPDGGMPLPDFNPMVPGRPNLPFANPEPDMGMGEDFGPSAMPNFPPGFLTRGGGGGMPSLPPELTQFGGRGMPALPPEMIRRNRPFPAMPQSAIRKGQSRLRMPEGFAPFGNTEGFDPMAILRMLLMGGLGRR